METGFLDDVVFGNSIRSYILFAVILIVGLLFKRIVSKLLSRLLYWGLKSVHAGSDSGVFIGLLLRPIELLMLLFTLYLAINQLDFPLNEVIFRRTQLVNKVQTVYELKLIRVVDKLFLFLFIFSFFNIILRIIDFIAHIFLFKASLTESKSDDQMVPFLKELTKIVTIIFGVFVVLGSVFDLNVATIIAGLGIGGIAVALAAQDTLQNLLGSFTIFADKPFLVGDVVKTDKYEGTVEKVGFRSTLIRTVDKTMVVIPNKKMVDSPLENLSQRNSHKIKFTIALKYDTSPEAIPQIVSEIESFINSNKGVTRETSVSFESLGDTALNIVVQYFVDAAPGNDVAKIREAINYKVIDIVNNHGAKFALPSQTLYHEYGEKQKGMGDGGLE